MIIKVKVNPKDTLTEAPHEPHPVDRRTFIKTGMSTLGSLMIAPNILSAILSSRAFAADLLTLSSMPTMSFTSLELSGGAGLSRIFAPFRQDGSSFAGSNTAVLGFNSGTPFSNSLIKGLYVNSSDPFYQCIMRGGSIVNGGRPGEDKALVSEGDVSRIMNCVSGTVVSAFSQDDFSGNASCALAALQMARKGSIVNALRVGDTPKAANLDGIGEKDVVVFGGADPGDSILETFFDVNQGSERSVYTTPKYYPKSSGSLEDLVSSIALSTDLSLNSGDASLLQEAAQGMMRVQQNAFKSTSGAKGFFESLYKTFSILPERADYNGMKNKLALDSPDLSAVNQIFQNTSRFSTLDRKKAIACAANARGSVGSVSIVEAGYDYHFGNGLQDFEVPHQIVARNVLLWAATHVALGKEGFMHIFSDGSLSWNGDKPIGDNGSIAQVILLHVKPNGSPASMRPMNYVIPSGNGAGEAASPNHLVAQTPGHQAMCALATYLKITGHLNNDADINAILAVYGNRLGLDKSKLVGLSAA